MTKITAISDLHGYYPNDLVGGDILIIAGDMALNDFSRSWGKFFNWLKKQDYKHKVIVAGNHDNFLTQCCSTLTAKEMNIDEEDFDYYHLIDEMIELEGIKIYGSPWTPLVDGVNPRCTAFMLPEQDLLEKFQKIPEGLDILVTHSPPWGILDQTINSRGVKNCGSRFLTHVVLEAKPKLHLFGHIHYCGFKSYRNKDTIFLNCSYVDEDYYPRENHWNIKYQNHSFMGYCVQ